MAFSLTLTSAVPACRSLSKVAVRGINGRSLLLITRAESKESATKEPVKATSDEASSEFDSEKMFKELKEQWDAVEDKTSIAVYGVGAVTLLWLSSTLVSAINTVPVVPKLMELVGLGYTAWFVYRYLLFKDSRKELITDVEELKKKISGDGASD